MAKPYGGGDDNVTQLDEENLAAAGVHTAGQFAPVGRFNLTISGVFVAQLGLSRTFDGGFTWVPCGVLGVPVVYGAPCSEQLMHSGEKNVFYRIDVLAFTSGVVHVRLSQ